MAKELIISANRHETKAAILEDDQLVEIYFQRTNEYSLAGSIHKGRVTRVLPGMQSAFVDIGLERDAFLYVSDFFEENEDFDRIPEEKKAAPAPAPAPRPAPAQERGEDGDRRGRRQRRRRGRGRGFPESKYAPEAALRPREGREFREEPEPESPAPPAPAGEFPVLPGESLAKYQRPGDEADSESPEAAVEAPGPEFPPEFRRVSSKTEERAIEPALSAESAESAQESETPDILDEAAQAAGPEPHARPPAHLRMTPPADLEVESEQPLLAELPEGAEPIAEASGEIPDLGTAPAAPEPGAEDAVQTQEGQPEAAPAESAQADEVEPARMPVSLTATLREQGFRYMHRTSRRMRRKMRGGLAEPHPAEREHAAEPERPSETRPESRTVSRPDRPPQPSISDLLKEGQEILVQVAKEPLGQKGARITSHIALPGRYVVYMPTVEHIGVSRKIASDEERARLKRILQANRDKISGGCIVRTAGEGRSEEEMVADLLFLHNLWLDIRQKAERKSAPALILHDLDLVERLLRDQVTDAFKAVWVDNEDVYEQVLRFCERFQPALLNRVKLYTRPTPIFDAFNVTAEMEKALRPKVWLKSGGYIVINQTEALVAIDVNTGKFVGKSNRLEDTILKTNTEAVREIVRQVRLRDLGGIIVVDFIDMDERKNRQKIFQAMEEAMRADRAPYKILQFNDFGLLAITRKRVKQSLERTLCSPCPYCEGAGYVKSVQTVIGEILQEAHKLGGVIEGKEALLRVSPDVGKVLKSTENTYLEELEEILKKPVLVTTDPTLHQEKFDLV